jgi:hypothetical protein
VLEFDEVATQTGAVAKVAVVVTASQIDSSTGARLR